MGGTGVAVGNWGVGVPVGAKDAQAETPSARNKIKNRLICILEIIPIKKVGHVSNVTYCKILRELRLSNPFRPCRQEAWQERFPSQVHR